MSLMGEICLYLLADGSRHGNGEGPDHSPSQVLSFPLLAELAQLLLLLLVQGVAVPGLERREGGLRTRGAEFTNDERPDTSLSWAGSWCSSCLIRFLSPGLLT